MSANIEYEIINKQSQAMIGLDFIKNYLRISHDYDDDLIILHMRSAADMTENFLEMQINQIVVKATITQISSKIILPHRPILEIKSAIAYNKNNAGTDVAEQLSLNAKQGVVTIKNPEILHKKLELVYEAGSEIQQNPMLLNALLQLVRKLYESGPDEMIDSKVMQDIFFHVGRRVKI